VAVTVADTVPAAGDRTSTLLDEIVRSLILPEKKERKEGFILV
jgi:hypothetical protein